MSVMHREAALVPLYVTCFLSGLLNAMCYIAPGPLQSMVADFNPAAVLPRMSPEAVIASWSPTKHKSSQTGRSRLSDGGTPHTGDRQRDPVSPPLSPRSAIAGQPEGFACALLGAPGSCVLSAMPINHNVCNQLLEHAGTCLGGWEPANNQHPDLAC